MNDEFNFDLKSFKYFAGHSLGEYSALLCADALKFEDAIYLLHERGKAMQEAVPVGQGSMLAVLGSDIKKINSLLSSLKLEKGVCEIANDNALGQVIISGDKKSVQSFQMLLKQNKIKSIPLKVSAPFHCSLMKKAAEAMRGKINKTDFKNPSIDIVSNVNANSERDVENIKRLLIDQIYSTVKWRESLIHMFNNDVKNFVEIGPGKVLTGMVKRTLTNSKCFSINSIADIKNLQNEFKG